MITEKEWKMYRNYTRKLFVGMTADIKTAEHFKVLTNAEKTVCGYLMFQLEDLLRHWEERSKASKMQFVEGGKDDKDSKD